MYLSCGMRFPTMWYVRPAKVQTSLRICAVWSEPLLVAWIFYDYYATDQAWFGVSKLQRRPHRLVWVNTCQNATLLEITCRCSFHVNHQQTLHIECHTLFILDDVAKFVFCCSYNWCLPVSNSFCILMLSAANVCKQFRPRSCQTKCLACSGFKQFYTVI